MRRSIVELREVRSQILCEVWRSARMTLRFEDSSGTRATTTITQEGEDARADQRESGRFRDRCGESDHLSVSQHGYAGIEYSVDGFEESIGDQALSDSTRMEAIGQE